MRTFIFGWNVQTWTYFLPGLEGGPNSLLWQYLALPSGDENYFATPRVVVRPRRQDDQPNSDARTRGKLSTSACQCYRSRWSWVWETSFWQLSQLTNSQTVPVKDSLWGRRWWKQHWKQRFPRRRRLLCWSRVWSWPPPAGSKSIEDSGLTELWIHRRRELAQPPKILRLTNYRGEQLTIFCCWIIFLSQSEDIHQ